MRYIALSFVVVPVFSTTADAQTFHNSLRGLSKIQLTIEELDPSSISCGLTKSAIQDAVKYPLSFTKLQLDEDSSEDLYVNVSSLYFPSDPSCVSSIEVEAYSFQVVNLTFSARTIGVSVKLWNHGNLLSSVKSEHVQRVKQEIEDETKHFITDWNLDNKEAP
jgi:hypothetical protein